MTSEQMKNKLLLINPFSQYHKGLGNSRNKYPPLGLGIVAAYTPENWEIKIIDENFERFTFEKADLVAISAFTAQINRAYQIADIYLNEKIPVVIGGIHASFLPEEAILHCNSVVIGEAETSWVSVISDFEQNKLKKFYKGGFANLDNIKLPRRDLFDKRYELSSVISSRGCPFGCDFCSVSSFYGTKTRFMPIEKVILDINSVKNGFIWFADNNLFGNSKKEQEWAKSLFREMISKKIEKKWFCFANLHSCLDTELLSLAREAGCRMVFLGFETEDDKMLLNSGKDHQSQLFKNVFDNMHNAGLGIFAGMVLGLEDDNAESIRQRVNFIIESPIDCYWVTVNTPLPGSKIFERLLKEDRIIKNNFPPDWDYYNWKHPVFKHHNLSDENFTKELKDAYSKLYNKKTIAQKYRQTIINTGNVEIADLCFITNMNNAAVFNEKQ